MTSSTNLPAPSELAQHWALDPSIVFLNHGSFGACPKAILEQQQQLRARMEAEPVRFLSLEMPALLDESRERLARLLNTAPENLAFVPNATTGVNAVVRSLEFQAGDEILTTNQDYNACRNALKAAAERAGAKVVVVEVPFPIRDEAQVVDAIMSRVGARTRLAMIDHVTSPTAVVYPIEKIVRALEERGIDTLVDGAHAPGMLPVDLDELRPAYYTGNCHKWLCSPKGAGFLYVRPDRQERIQPTTISHGYNTPRPGRNALHTGFDWVGTIDPTAWLCVGNAIDWCSTLLPGGFSELMERNRALAVEARRILCETLGIDPSCPEGMLGSMATILLPEPFQKAPFGANTTDPVQTRLFDEYGVEVPVMRWGEPGRRYLRVSAHGYNLREQYSYLAMALKELASRAERR
ncbi:MAG TPA: aminotransferase class V-fold PLP-dependent enzyme [Verrucomicrobiae bacterium]|nr:aminotransferase class V-fold PLP-dependent enzyme [Verrucomicrobiae bacterium]